MFWDNFVALCAKQNKSPNAVISEIGCASSAAVTGWKRGAQPRAKVLKMIADYFDIPVSELVEDEKGTHTNTKTNYAELSEAHQKAIDFVINLTENEAVILVNMGKVAFDKK